MSTPTISPGVGGPTLQAADIRERVWWTIKAFLEKAVTPLWWLGLVSGILMIVLAFWTSGQFFLEKAYTLLIFAGIWAMLHGITDIVRAFGVRSLRGG